MKEFHDKVNEVAMTTTAVAREIAQGVPMAATFRLAVALADLIRADPGACAAAKKSAQHVLDTMEKTLAEEGTKARAKRWRKTGARHGRGRAAI